MVRLHGIDVPLEDLPMICYCGRWSCPMSYKGKRSTLKKLENARRLEKEKEKEGG